jgi:hypothetical protein
MACISLDGNSGEASSFIRSRVTEDMDQFTITYVTLILLLGTYGRCSKRGSDDANYGLAVCYILLFLLMYFVRNLTAHMLSLQLTLR